MVESTILSKHQYSEIISDNVCIVTSFNLPLGLTPCSHNCKYRTGLNSSHHPAFWTGINWPLTFRASLSSLASSHLNHRLHLLTALPLKSYRKFDYLIMQDSPHRSPFWEQAVTKEGIPYFVNHLTKNTSWVDPRTLRPSVPSTQSVYILKRYKEELWAALKPKSQSTSSSTPSSAAPLAVTTSGRSSSSSVNQPSPLARRGSFYGADVLGMTTTSVPLPDKIAGDICA
jgi:hypothetical protein